MGLDISLAPIRLLKKMSKPSPSCGGNNCPHNSSMGWRRLRCYRFCSRRLCSASVTTIGCPGDFRGCSDGWQSQRGRRRMERYDSRGQLGDRFSRECVYVGGWADEGKLNHSIDLLCQEHCWCCCWCQYGDRAVHRGG